MKKILIIAATSSIAEHYARWEAERGSHLILAGRSEQRMNAIADDLRTRGADRVEVFTLDINDRAGHARVLDQAASGTPLDVILVAHGTLPDQQACLDDPERTAAEFTTNATATIAFMVAAARVLCRQGQGTLAVISSVAGDRGRASNALYGSAKAAVSAFASGLRQQLHATGVNVLTIKPGFVDTPMTAGFRKGILWSQPRAVARIIARAINRGRSTVYAPGFWKLIMLAIIHIPEPLFRRMRL